MYVSLVHSLVFPAPTFQIIVPLATPTPPTLTSSFLEAASKHVPTILLPTPTAGSVHLASLHAKCAQQTLLAPPALTATTSTIKPVRSTVLWASLDSIRFVSHARIVALPAVVLLLTASLASLEHISTIAQRLAAVPLAQRICIPTT